MKQYSFLLFFLLLANCQFLHAQTLPDSIINKYKNATGFQAKQNSVLSYLRKFSTNDRIETKRTLELLSYFQKENDPEGLNIMQTILGLQFSRKKDYNTSLNYLLKALSGFKERKDTTAILYTNIQIGYSYGDAMNDKDGLNYLKDNLRISIATGSKRGIANAYNQIATVYAVIFMPDSGLMYAYKGLNIGYELKDDTLITYLLGTIAENYIVKGDCDLAISFLRKSKQLMYTIDEYLPYRWFYNAYAQAYLGMKKYDSTLFYAHRSLSYSIPENDLVQQLRTYKYLFTSYDGLNKQDSSYKYFRLAAILKDSIISTEKVKAMEATTFREVLRQQELETQKLIMEEEQNQNIQYSLISLGIVSFLILFFLLSRSIIVTEKWISFFGILGLLLIFEFINLLIHPFLERITHHSPFLMLLALVAIASLLIPLHHKMEKWIKEKMTEKNKKIRLENARKTIEELEGSSNGI